LLLNILIFGVVAVLVDDVVFVASLLYWIDLLYVVHLIQFEVHDVTISHVTVSHSYVHAESLFKNKTAIGANNKQVCNSSEVSETDGSVHDAYFS
jgi:hypothetical protein